MSQPAFSALEPLPFELVFDDGEPMENNAHAVQLQLLIDVTHRAMWESGRTEFHAGGNNFVYYSMEQAWEVASGRLYFRGPDFFFVDQVPRRPRKGWVSWEEGGRLPDLILEMLSPTTEKVDRTTKMDLYARVFRTREYFLWDFDRLLLEGYRLEGDRYQPMQPDSQGRLRSEVLGFDLGAWHGPAWIVYPHESWDSDWVRLFDSDGRLIPQGALAHAEEAQAELKRLRSLLGERGE
ncbi:MAG TPA: Uma2 family endonuclease [Thermoanaerobaculia bacterium]|nr:Uma2 family endonuclease [Thermoanaerobaculia bacterium]